MTPSTTPGAYESDPRLSSPSTYSRQECIEVIRDLLHYLSNRLPYLDSAWILEPPANGWPNITPQTFAPLEKTAEVIELLANLPYVHIPNQNNQYAPERNWPAIKRYTHLYDFRGEAYQAALEKVSKGGNDTALSDDLKFQFQVPWITVPPWVICLTTGLKHGDFLLLDTSDGTITKYISFYGYYDPDYAEDDRRHWRDECTTTTKNIREYFQDLKDEIENQKWLAYFSHGRPTMMYPEDSPQKAEVCGTSR
ncbi:hypothetical protein DV737_g977, partial [Chaetothyriales sp. CBS 132003]